MMHLDSVMLYTFLCFVLFISTRHFAYAGNGEVLARIDRMEEEYNSLREEYEDKMEEYSSKLEALTEGCGHQFTKTLKHSQAIAGLNIQNRQHQEKRKSQSVELNKQLRIHSDKIEAQEKAIATSNVFYGFSSAMDTSNKVKAYKAGDRIQFPNVLSNFGGYYNAKLHEFTCPVTGIYLCSTSTMSGHNGLGVVLIMLDNTRLVSTYANGRNIHYGHSTNMVVAHCKKGQKVWVKTDRSITVWRGANNYNTFSAMLLKRN